MIPYLVCYVVGCTIGGYFAYAFIGGKTMRLLVGVLLSVCLMLGACNGGSDDGDSNISREDLPQTFTYTDRSERFILTVYYPSDWFASNQVDFGLGLTNSETALQALLDGQGARPEAGVISGNFLFFDFSSLSDINVTADTPLPVALSAYAQAVFGVGINADNIDEVSINGTIVATTTVDDDGSSVQFVTKSAENGLVIAYFGTVEGGIDQFHDTVVAITAYADVAFP